MCCLVFEFPCNFRVVVFALMLDYVLDVYGFLQILGFSVACCSLCVGFMVSLQILGFSVTCCSFMCWMLWFVL
jgi:hypothetical protein